MADYINPAFLELQGIVKTVWPWLGSAGKQLRDTQTARIKWLEFVQKYQSGQATGLNVPFVVEEFGLWSSANDPNGFGYAGDNQKALCSIFLIDTTDELSQTITIVNTGTGAVGVASTARYFAGQNVVVRSAGSEVLFTTIVSVDSSVQVTLATAAGVSAGMTLDAYDKTEQLYHEAQLLRAALDPAVSFTNFWTVELATVNASSSNPANAVLAKPGYNLQAVQVTTEIFVGL